MANYKESSVNGTQWTRSNAVRLSNPYQGVPSITFEEERIIQAGNTVVRQQVFPGVSSDVTLQFTDATKTFPLLDPATDLPTGTATYGQVYALLYSLYRAAAAARDAKP